jgi:hypothetical protein
MVCKLASTSLLIFAFEGKTRTGPGEGDAICESTGRDFRFRRRIQSARKPSATPRFRFVVAAHPKARLVPPLAGEFIAELSFCESGANFSRLFALGFPSCLYALRPMPSALSPLLSALPSCALATYGLRDFLFSYALHIMIQG